MILKINGIPVTELYTACKKLETITGICDAMGADQMEMYVSLKIQTLQAIAESAEKIHAPGTFINLADTGFAVTKFIAARLFEGAGVVLHVASIHLPFPITF